MPSALLRPLVPDELELQEFDGTAWLGLVPFRMAGVMRRPWPDLPEVSEFPELNVRTYVTARGKPGVWFLSLDAPNPLVVWAARRYFHLPYFRARIVHSETRRIHEFASARPGAVFQANYRPVSEPYHAQPGSLEHWLTERYCLYAAAPDGTIWRNEVHHKPWPLQAAEASLAGNTMLDVHGIELPEQPARIHFAKRLDVVMWDADRVV